MALCMFLFAFAPRGRLWRTRAPACIFDITLSSEDEVRIVVCLEIIFHAVFWHAAL